MYTSKRRELINKRLMGHTGTHWDEVLRPEAVFEGTLWA